MSKRFLLTLLITGFSLLGGFSEDPEITYVVPGELGDQLPIELRFNEDTIRLTHRTISRDGYHQIDIAYPDSLEPFLIRIQKGRLADFVPDLRYNSGEIVYISFDDCCLLLLPQ